MQFLTLLISAIVAIPAPSSNYQLLSKAISDFQATSDQTFELVNAALSQQSKLLDSFSIDAVGQVNIFLPSDSGFLSLNLPALSKNDLYTYLQYHFTLKSLESEPAHLKTFLGDDVKLNYTSGKLSQVITEFDAVSTVIGTSNPIPNINLFFVDEVLRPPHALPEIAKHYNWTAAVVLLSNQNQLKLTPIAKDNTFLVPSETATKKFLADHPKVNWTASMVSEIAGLHHITTARLFSDELKDGNVTTTAGIKVFYHTNGTVVISGPYNNVTVEKSNVLVERGVAHQIDGVLLPFEI